MAAYAGIGTAFLCGCAGVARLLGDPVRARFGDDRVVLGALTVAAAGMLTVGLTEGFAAHATGLAIIGIGTAYLVPCLFAIAARRDPAARAARIGLLQMMGGPARIGAPFVFGWLAHFASPAIAFGLFSLAMLAAAILFVASQSMTAAKPAIACER
jgi:dipeptide/tripeptide permease